jgi:hypothetical protein
MIVESGSGLAYNEVIVKEADLNTSKDLVSVEGQLVSDLSPELVRHKPHRCSTFMLEI